MAKKTWLSHILVYLLWAVLIALGFWFLILSREVFLTGAAYYAGDSWTRGWQTRFLDKAFFLLMGVAVLVFILLTENYLREGVEKHTVLRRFEKVAGWTVLVIAAADVVLLFLQQFAGVTWLRWLIIAAEVGIGVALSWLGRRAPKPQLTQGNFE